ncbi:MAG: response regulator [Nannocystaceae bacterium]
MRTGNNTELDVMLVDDNDDDIVVMQEMFSRVGGASVAGIAFDGIEALEHLERTIDRSEKLPDVVLLDLNMPRMNGFEFLESLQSRPALTTIPIVVFSTSRRTEDVERAYSLGAATYVAKPSDFDQLKNVVSSLVNYWRGIALLPGEGL